jgi:hypothetical protein
VVKFGVIMLAGWPNRRVRILLTTHCTRTNTVLEFLRLPCLLKSITTAQILAAKVRNTLNLALVRSF